MNQTPGQNRYPCSGWGSTRSSSSLGINKDNSVHLKVFISINCRQLSRQKDERVKGSEQKYFFSPILSLECIIRERP